MLVFIIVCIAAWILQSVFLLIQMKHFNRHFSLLRKEGRVVVGRSKGRFGAGAVVMLLITKEGEILRAKRMKGFSTLARLRDFSACDGRNLLNLDKSHCANFDAKTWAAILDAAGSYRGFLEKKPV